MKDTDMMEMEKMTTMDKVEMETPETVTEEVRKQTKCVSELELEEKDADMD